MTVGKKFNHLDKFIEFKEIKIASSNGWYMFSQYFVYDKTTKIVYVAQRFRQLWWR